jgi:hypothetical protein
LHWYRGITPTRQRQIERHNAVSAGHREFERPQFDGRIEPIRVHEHRQRAALRSRRRERTDQKPRRATPGPQRGGNSVATLLPL